MTQLTWNTAAEWDNAASESGVVHESVTNTDHTDGAVVKQGYSVASPYLSADLIGYWPLHEDSGTTAYDFSGNNYNGTINGATIGATGLLGSTVYSLDGSDDYVDYNTQLVSNKNSFTISFWARVSSGQGNPAAFGETNNASSPYLIIYYGDTATSPASIRIMNNDGTTNARIDGATAVDDGNWHHVAYVRRAAGDHEIYLDAVSDGTSTTAPNTFSTTVQNFGGISGYGQHMAGDMADVRIYNRDLTDSELQTLNDVVATSGSLITAEKTS